MTSTPTERNRLEKQAFGANPDSWDLVLNRVLDRIDESLDGVVVIDTGVASSPYTLSVNGFDEDEARKRVIVLDGDGESFTVVVPKVEKIRYVYNKNQVSAVLFSDGDNEIEIPRGFHILAHTGDDFLLIQNTPDPKAEDRPIFILEGLAAGQTIKMQKQYENAILITRAAGGFETNPLAIDPNTFIKFTFEDYTPDRSSRITIIHERDDSLPASQQTILRFDLLGGSGFRYIPAKGAVDIFIREGQAIVTSINFEVDPV